MDLYVVPKSLATKATQPLITKRHPVALVDLIHLSLEVAFGRSGDHEPTALDVIHRHTVAVITDHDVANGLTKSCRIRRPLVRNDVDDGVGVTRVVGALDKLQDRLRLIADKAL